jgi:hypothetical protein
LLTPPIDSNDLVITTDASDSHWALVISQCIPGELDKPMEMQSHHPVVFASGMFKGASLRWATWEKELFPIIQAVKRFNFILHRERGFVCIDDA